MADMFYNIFGNLTYSDGSSGLFEASYQNGILSSGMEDKSATESLVAFEQLFADNASDVNALLTAFGTGSHALFDSVAAAPSPDKTVTGFVMQVNGRLSRDDGTSEDFAVQYDLAERALTAAEGTTAYAEVLADAPFLAAIDSAFEKICGAGNATITA